MYICGVKNKIVHSLFSILISFIVVLPFAVQTLHAIEGHEHTVCTAENEHHFHQQEVDCSTYHQIIEHNAIKFSIKFELKTLAVFKKIYTYNYQNKYPSHLQFKASRAPPYFIV